MKLNFGIDYKDLNNLEGLKKLDQIFLNFLYKEDLLIHNQLLAFRALTYGVGDQDYSDFLLDIASVFNNFLARLFNIEQEVTNLIWEHQEFDIIYECKRKFIQRFALKKYPQDQVQEIDFSHVCDSLVKFLNISLIRFHTETLHTIPDDTLILLDKRASTGILFCISQKKFSKQVLQWLLHQEKYAVELDIAAQFVAYSIYNTNNQHILFTLPEKVDKDNLITPSKLTKWKKQTRKGFDGVQAYTVPLDEVLNEAHYCIYCHHQGKDSCSKGFKLRNQFHAGQHSGCPLKQKISEMNYVKAKGFILSALAIIIIDNPMVAATGHRICNACSAACIYQKQDPVNIPLIESNILESILELPYGVEIYLLLTKWNPLNIFSILPKEPTNYKILVVGLGPAGFSLSYYLLRDGHQVVAIDGLKITNLPFDIHTPIKYWSDHQEKLSEKMPQGFGGVSEYGITVRWDKNKLSLLRLILERNKSFKFFGGVRLGSNITLNQAFDLGFDHVAFCTGAGKPKIIDLPNFLAKGVRTAADFLMTLQSGGAFLNNSLTSLVIRMPIAIIGGGLTAVDSAVESVHYYKLQVEKFFHNYQSLIEQYSKNYIEKSWTTEDKLVAEEFIEHAKLFQKAAGREEVQKIINDLGGVTIYYRQALKEAPAYRENHEEIVYALNEGVDFVDNMIPIALHVDAYNHVQSIEFNHLGVKKEVKARTLLTAIGTEVSIPIAPHSDQEIYKKNRISYFGDCDPLFSGSVVQAIASSKEGYPLISSNLQKNEPNFRGTYIDFFMKLDSLLLSRVQHVTPLADKITEVVIHTPLVAQNFLPGQFFKLQNYTNDPKKLINPLALTGAYADKEKGLLHFVVFERGVSSIMCKNLIVNELVALMGPIGQPTQIVKNQTIALIGDSFGSMALYPASKAFKEAGCIVIYIVSYTTKPNRYYQEKIEASADNIIWCCVSEILPINRPQDTSVQGTILNGIEHLALINKSLVSSIDHILAVGSGSMIQSLQKVKNKFFRKDIKLITSINAPMQCMMQGICGRCVQKNDRKYIFGCICQEYEAKYVDFLSVASRLAQDRVQEQQHLLMI